MLIPDDYNFVCPVKMISGKRALELLPVELNALNATRPFMMIDQTQSGKKRLNTLIKAFGDSGMHIGIYNMAGLDQNMAAIKQLADVFQEKECDSVIVVGEGALVDMAKVMNMAVSGNFPETSAGVNSEPVQGTLKPLIHIPTHCGYGFESSPRAQVGNTTCISVHLMPAIILIDPRMIESESPQAIFNASMIALAHAADAYTGIAKNPLKDAYAFTAIQLIKTNLVNVLQNQAGLEGKLALVNAAAMAGCTLQPTQSDDTSGGADRLHFGMTGVLAQAASELAHLDYGVCLGLLLPFTLEFHLSSDSAFGADLLPALSDADTVAATTPHLRAAVAINRLRHFLHELHAATNGKIPRTLAEAGMPRFILNDIAAKVLEKGVKRYTLDDYITVLEHAWDDKPFFIVK